MKLLEENIGTNSHHLGLGNGFLIYNTKTTSKKSTLDFIKIKNICALNDTIKKMKKQPTEWERLFTSHISKRDLYLKYTKTHKTQQFKKKR